MDVACLEGQLHRLTFTREYLKHNYPESVNIALLREPADGGVLRGKVPHGGARLEGREDQVVDEELVQAGTRNQRFVGVIHKNFVRRYVLVNKRGLVCSSTVQISNSCKINIDKEPWFCKYSNILSNNCKLEVSKVIRQFVVTAGGATKPAPAY